MFRAGGKTIQGCSARVDRCRSDPEIDGFSEGWNVPSGPDVPSSSAGLSMSKACLVRSEYPMNIFYIIGVVVVVIFVAGFFGLHL
jgi:hypothetical protein